MFPMNNSLLSGLATVVVIVALLGGAVGIGFSDTDLLNFNRSAAEARALDSATEIQSRKDLIDLQVYTSVRTAEGEAELTRIALETEALARELEQGLLSKQRNQLIGAIVVSLLVLTIGIGVAIFLIQYGKSRVVLAEAQAQAAKTDVWQDPVLRSLIIQMTRNKVPEPEKEEKLTRTRINTSNGNGRHPTEIPAASAWIH